MLKRQLKLQRQAAADLIGLAHYSWNPQTNVLNWDARLKAMWGLPPDIEPDYETWRNAIHPKDVNRVDAAVARCKDPRDGVYDIKYRVIGLDGVERWIHTRGRTYFKNDRPTDFAGVMLDITPGQGSAMGGKHKRNSIVENQRSVDCFISHSSDSRLPPELSEIIEQASRAADVVVPLPRFLDGTELREAVIEGLKRIDQKQGRKASQDAMKGLLTDMCDLLVHTGGVDELIPTLKLICDEHGI